MALSLRGANQIIDTMTENKVVATIGYVDAVSKIYDKVSKVCLVESWKIKRMMFELSASASYRIAIGYLIMSKSGGLLVEHGVHFFDIFSVSPENLSGEVVDTSPRETFGNSRIYLMK